MITLISRWLILLLICLLIATCTTKPSPTEEENSGIEAASKLEEQSTQEQSAEPADKSLIIHGKEIWVRKYPNTGKVVMKLNEGNVCKILKVGRYDVIRGKGSHWYQIEFKGQTGWVFGSQTDKESEEWDIIRSSGISKYLLQNLPAPDSNELFIMVGKAIKKTEIIPTGEENDEPKESKSVDIKTNSINADWISGEGTAIMEEFKKSKSMDMLQLWTYHYTMGAAYMVAWDNTIVVSQKDSKSTIVTELPGKAIEIHRLKNGMYLVVGKYELFDMGTDKVGFINFAVYDPGSNKILSEQKLGYCRAPKFYASPFNYYAEKIDFELVSNNEKLLLTIMEDFNQLDSESNSIQKGISKRFYQFNVAKNLFEENRQEEVREQ
jgi:GTPase SAR1 family protein